MLLNLRIILSHNSFKFYLLFLFLFSFNLPTGQQSSSLRLQALIQKKKQRGVAGYHLASIIACEVHTCPACEACWGLGAAPRKNLKMNPKMLRFYAVLVKEYAYMYHFHTSDQRVKPVHISYIALVLEC